MFNSATGDFSTDGYYDMTPEDYVLTDPVKNYNPVSVDYPPTTFRDLRIAEKDKTRVTIPTATSNQTTYLIVGAIALYFLMG
jgi:hypothetical protein